MKRSILWPFAACIGLAACAPAEAPPEPVRAVRTLVVAPATAGGRMEFAAEVRSRVESRLSFRVGGKMVSRRAELGQRVRAGDLLAQLDPQDLRLGEEAARAAVEAARVNRDLAAAELKRFRELRDQGFVSAFEIERRESTLRAAEAQLEQSRAQADLQGNQSAHTRLVANAAGVITAVEAEVGAVLAAGTPVLRLAHDGARDAVFSVPEDAVAGLRLLLGREGALQVRLWDRADAVPGTLRELAAAADPVTRTFLAKADVGAAAVQLGQTATVIVELPRVEGVAKLPLTAIKEHDGRTSVWIVDESTMTVRPQPIEVAGAEENDVVVSGGIAPGQRIVTAGVHVLNPGQKVRLYAGPGAVATAAAAAGSAAETR
ncbi:MAG: efflux RND transporter periplasmic adaptor subunit [Rubrivivax sp.]|jgi:RND family efflux transporter MFP subunit|nr:efflux RND transporter periplasmic adaptor subunit [Rubrivivax sp.]